MSMVQWTQSGMPQPAEAFWRRQLSAPLPSRGLLPETDDAKTRVEAIVQTEMPAALSDALLQLACGDDASLQVLLLAVFHVFLDRLSVEGGANAVLCSVGPCPGDSAAMAPICARTRAGQSFRELVFELRETVLEARLHAGFDLRQIAALVPGRDPALLGRYVLASRQIGGAFPVGDAQLAFEIDRVGARLDLALHFDASRWREATARLLLNTFVELARRAVSDPRRSLADIGRLSVQVDEYGHRAPAGRTVIEMFEAAAQAYAQHPALVSMSSMPNLYDPGVPRWLPASMSYEALNGRANLLARALLARGAAPRAVVGILVEDPFKQIEAQLAVAKAGSAYLTLDERQPAGFLARLAASGVTHLIAETRLLQQVQAAGEPRLAVIDPDTAVVGIADPRNLAAGPDPASPCYVCYTSGTTGPAMKGVIVDHGAIANYTAWRMRAFASSSQDVTLQLVPWSADGSGANLFPTLCAGGTLVVPPRAARTDPGSLSLLMAHFGVTQMSLVPSVFRDLLPHLDANAVRRLKTLVLAGEPATAELLEATLALAPHTEVCNEYGPTEATIATTLYGGMRPDSVRVIGRPIDNARVRVANHCGDAMPVGLPGEIWIAGAGLARGYLNDPETTRERFVEDAEGCRWYRSRDAGLWDAHGNLRYVGRLDRELKRFGRRIDLALIEDRLRHLAPNAEVRVDLDTVNQTLRSWLVGQPQLDVQAIRASLASELPAEYVPQTLHVVARLPRLNSDGMDAAALPAAQRAMDELETAIAAGFEELLGLPSGTVGCASNFFELGGHSLKVTQLAGRMLTALRVNLRISEIYDAPTVEALARCVRERLGSAGRAIPRSPDSATYPASREQLRIYRASPGAAANRTVVVRWRKPVDPGRLERAVAALVDRHEALRTSFELVGGELRQRVHPSISIGRIGDAVRLGFAFALDTAPLLRVSVEGDSVVLETHALVADAASAALLEADLCALYEGHPLPLLPLRQRDWTEWAVAGGGPPAREASARFWRDRLAAGAPRLGLARVVSAARPRMLRTANLAGGVNDRAFLFAAFSVALAAVAGRTRFVIGLGTSGRVDRDLRGVVGNFDVAAPVVCAIKKNGRFSELVAQARSDIAGAQEHQYFPFELLAEAEALPRDASGHPVFEAAFRPHDGPAWDPPPCALAVTASAGTVTAAYDPDAVDPAAVERFLASFVASSAAFAARPDAGIDEVMSTLEA